MLSLSVNWCVRGRLVHSWWTVWRRGLAFIAISYLPLCVSPPPPSNPTSSPLSITSSQRGESSRRGANLISAASLWSCHRLTTVVAARPDCWLWYPNDVSRAPDHSNFMSKSPDPFDCNYKSNNKSFLLLNRSLGVFPLINPINLETDLFLMENAHISQKKKTACMKCRYGRFGKGIFRKLAMETLSSQLQFRNRYVCAFISPNLSWKPSTAFLLLVAPRHFNLDQSKQLQQSLLTPLAIGS